MVHSGLTLRNPPGGDSLAQDANERIYLIRTVDDKLAESLPRWADKYSGKSLGSSTELGKGGWRKIESAGAISRVEIRRGPSSMQARDGEVYRCGSGEALVQVRDRAINLKSLWARLQVAVQFAD